MRIQHNMASSRAYRAYAANRDSVAKNLEKLSTGYRINRAGDDAAGLAISEKMRAQITGLGQARNNVKDGVGLIQTTESLLDELHEMARRLLALAEQSSNGTYDDGVDRAQLQKEADSLLAEYDRIADYGNFNTIQTLRGKPLIAKEAVAAEDEEEKNIPVEMLFQDLFRQSGARQGEITISLTWATSDDLDLHCVTADGSEISFSNKTAGGGTLDYDRTQGANVTTRAFENIYFSEPSSGNYTIRVRNYSDRTADDATEAVVRVSVGGKAKFFPLTIDGTGTTSHVVTFAYKEGQIGVFPEEVEPEPEPVLEPSDTLRLMIGDSNDDYNWLDVPLYDMHAASLDLEGLDLSTQEAASASMEKIATAIDLISGVRGEYGALQNRLEHTDSALANARENIQQAESVIRDTDVAEEMMEYTKNNILLQSAQAMMAQANQQPQTALQMVQAA